MPRSTSFFFFFLFLFLFLTTLLPTPTAAAPRRRRRRSNPSSNTPATNATNPRPSTTPPPPQSPATLHNWGFAYEFNVTKVFVPTVLSEVATVVKDTQAFPSPVRALGNIHSVTACVVSNGTVIGMRNLKSIVGMIKDNRGRQTVQVEAGVTLLELHEWLAQREFELPFAAEIGDATVGSLTSSISKDSGVGEQELTGSLYKAITGVTYVDHLGELVTLHESTNATQLAAFKSSEGLWGVVVLVDLLVLPRKLLTFTNHILPTDEMMAKFADHSLVVTPSTNYWILLHPEYSLLQERTLAIPDAVETSPETLAMIVNATRMSFAKGEIAMPLTAKSSKQKPLTWTTYKYKMVNHYGPLEGKNLSTTAGGMERLDFTWFEYPYERFQGVVYEYLQFVQRFKEEHDGFEPSAAATYFIKRIPEKPHGWFSQKGAGFDLPGLSFTLDPIYHDPHDPMWQLFLQESVAFARVHGGRTAVTQTRFLTREDFLLSPGNVALTGAPNDRFTSAFFEEFMQETASKPKAEVEVEEEAEGETAAAAKTKTTTTKEEKST